MLKLLAAALTALFVTASSVTYAQAQFPTPMERLNPTDLAKLTDERIEIVTAALQLTPDQMKYWPAVEDAIRTRAQNRQTRISRIVETVGKRSDDSVIDTLRNRNPVEFLNRRADALAQRSADLKKLADAWQPLYQTLTPEQKRRMAALAVVVLHEMSDALEQRRMQFEDDDEWTVITR
jgi:LTXXQ motif family protein